MHRAQYATCMFFGAHTSTHYHAIPIWVVTSCNKFKASDCKQWRAHVQNICASPAFPGTLVEGDPDGDSRRSKESEDSLYEESAYVPPPSLPLVPMVLDSVHMSANFDPPHIIERLRGFMFAGFVMEAEVSLGTLELLADRVSHPLPPNVTELHDKQNVEAAFTFF